MNRGIIHIEVDKDINYVDVIEKKNLTADEGITVLIYLVCALYKASRGTVEDLKEAIDAAWELVHDMTEEEAEEKRRAKEQ